VLPAGPFVGDVRDEPFQLLVRDEALLDSALATARQPYYPTVVDKAGALLRSMVKNHPFIDGNKRLGFAAMLTFLWANGYVFAANEQEAGDLVLDVASGHMSWEEVSGRLAVHAYTIEVANSFDDRKRSPVAWQIAFVPEFAQAVRDA
jgi:death-on-curing protein